MPRTHTSVFKIRFYECDAYGHVNNANYLRFMLEAAFKASAEAGFDHDRYRSLNFLWLIRETEIEYLSPLRSGDRVEVMTWVLDFRRVRSRRAYEFRRAGSEELVAKATTDWVFLDMETQRPTSIPDELKLAFFPEGPPEQAPPRKRFPTPPPPPPGVFKMDHEIAWHDVDAMFHLNNAAYLTYIEDCGVPVGAEFGWPLQRMMEKGYAWVARRHHIEYKQQATFEDELEIATWLSNPRRASVTRHYAVSRQGDGALLARVETLWAFVNLETNLPSRIPKDLWEDFAPNCVEP